MGTKSETVCKLLVTNKKPRKTNTKRLLHNFKPKTIKLTNSQIVVVNEMIKMVGNVFSANIAGNDFFMKVASTYLQMPVGSGKTFIVLGLIECFLHEMMLSCPQEMITFSKPSTARSSTPIIDNITAPTFSTLTFKRNFEPTRYNFFDKQILNNIWIGEYFKNCSQTNEKNKRILILLPKRCILGQWASSIRDYFGQEFFDTHVIVHTFNNYEVDKKILEKNFCIVLTHEKLYMERLHNEYFFFKFVDEAHEYKTFDIRRNTNSFHTWLVTATPSKKIDFDASRYTPFYLKEYLFDSMKRFFTPDKFSLISNQTCFNLPKIFLKFCKYISSSQVKILKSTFSSLEMINELELFAENEIAKFYSDTIKNEQENLSKIVSEFNTRVQNEYHFLKKILSAHIMNKINKFFEKINNSKFDLIEMSDFDCFEKSHILQLKQDYNRKKCMIERLIESKDDGICKICEEEFCNQKKFIFKCCQNAVCLVCLQKIAAYFCPYCRCKIEGVEEFIKICKIDKQTNDVQKKTLEHVFFDLINSNDLLAKKILVIYQNIKNKAAKYFFVNDEKLDPSSYIIVNTGNINVENKIHMFKTTERIRIFFLNADYCRYGLNIEFADVLIILNNISNYKQVIGRAYRYPRVNPLYIYKFSVELTDNDDETKKYRNYDDYEFSNIVKELNIKNNNNEDDYKNENNHNHSVDLV
jgi:hypothetical protein